VVLVLVLVLGGFGTRTRTRAPVGRYSYSYPYLSTIFVVLVLVLVLGGSVLVLDSYSRKPVLAQLWYRRGKFLNRSQHETTLMMFTRLDGWALSFFASSNVQWQSTTQTIGQTFGRFISSSVLMMLESANFTNRYVREPLGFQPQTHGLFTLEQFLRFWGIAFLVVTCCVAIIYRERNKSKESNEDEEKEVGLLETYLSIIKLFKKKCMWQLISILLVSPFGYAATYFMTNLALMG
jgi:hypothetical protein